VKLVISDDVGLLMVAQRHLAILVNHQ